MRGVVLWGKVGKVRGDDAGVACAEEGRGERERAGGQEEGTVCLEGGRREESEVG